MPIAVPMAKNWIGRSKTWMDVAMSIQVVSDANSPLRNKIGAVTDLAAAKETLLAELREHSLVIGEVTLSSGATAQYYVDARRALLRPAGFRAAGALIAAAAADVGASA